jgi:hypothetical protein
MVGRPKTRGKLARLLAFSLAILFVLFVSQAASHLHEKGQNEATCQICQAAHVAPAPAAGVPLVVAPLLATGYVQPFLSALHEELFFHDSPSRAPPSA